MKYTDRLEVFNQLMNEFSLWLERYGLLDPFFGKPSISRENKPVMSEVWQKDSWTVKIGYPWITWSNAEKGRVDLTITHK